MYDQQHYYKATVTTNNTNDTKNYIGMTATTFKECYANHTSSFRHKKDSKKTELSKHIWKLKENNQDYTIKWSILKHAISYTEGSKRCNLCLEEKFCILKDIKKIIYSIKEAKFSASVVTKTGFE
jgi:hypothetical protein